MFTFYFIGGSEAPETTIEELKVVNIEGVKEGQVFETQKVRIRVKTKPVSIDSLTINGKDVEDEEGIFNTDYLFEENFEEGNNKALIVAKHGDQEITKEINFKVDLTKQKAEEKAKKEEESRKEKIKNVSVVVDDNYMYFRNNNKIEVNLNRVAINCDINEKCSYYQVYAPMLDLPAGKIITIELNDLVDEETETKRFNPFTEAVTSAEIQIYAEVDGFPTAFTGYNFDVTRVD